MHRCLLLALGFLAAMPLLHAANSPTVIVQVAPITRLIPDIKFTLKVSLGPGTGDSAIRSFERGLEDRFGEKGFEGLDINRPSAAYVTVPEDLEKTIAVFVLPISSEKEFLALLERVKVTARERNGAKGLYELEDFPTDDSLPSTMRFVDGHVYIAMNDEDGSTLDAAKRIAAAKLIDPGESADLTVRVLTDGLPKKNIASTLKKLNDAARAESFAQDPKTPGGAFKQTFAEQGAKFLTRITEQLLDEAKEARFRVGINPTEHEAFYEFAVVPRPGTALAKSIAEWKPSPTPLAGMISKETVLTYGFQLPLFAPELCNIGEVGMTALSAEATPLVPPFAKPTVEAFFKGLGRTMKAGNGDVMVSCNAPNKEGHYTALAGISFDDPSAVEKELRAMVKDLPELVRGRITLDADSAGKVTLHVLTPGELLPEQAATIFGPSAKAVIAFAPKAVIVGIGPDALAAVKAAVLAPPGVAKAMDMSAFPRKLLPLIRTFNPSVTEATLKQFNVDPDRLSNLGTTIVTGGKELKSVTSGLMMNTNWLFLTGTPPELDP